MTATKQRTARLSDLVSDIEGASTGGRDPEIRGIAVDSRAVRPGDLFVAIAGKSRDGHAFLADAARSGAAAALVERDLPGAPLPLARVPSTAAALASVAVRFHRDPSAHLSVAGVTGTNGKTTVAYALESILSAAGRRSAVLGTINYRIAGETVGTGLTTPFPHELQALMAEAGERGATHVVMEVSSHSAAQGRIAGVRFDVGIFTNLSHDHLDFHGDMESYFAAKARFFREFLPAGGKRARMAINADDPFGRRLSAEFPGAMTFGFAPTASVRPEGIEMTPRGTRMRLVGLGAEALELRTALIGAYNASNVMAAACGAILLGVPPGAIPEGIERLASIPGRVESIPNGLGITIVVDYAHTPDGLDRLLSSLQDLAAGRVITVFGCGGNRDRAKRPEMGRIAARRSDVVVVTSDNPRHEDPHAIIGEIVPGVAAEGLIEAHGEVDWEDGYYIVVADRKKAISRALAVARPGDTIAIAGKGHENVQIVGDRCLPFDDRETVRELLRAGG